MHICTKYCTEKAHAHSDASMTINGHNIHQNLKRAVEREIRNLSRQNSVNRLCQDNLCAPQSSVMSTHPKKGIPTNFMALIPPFFAFTQLGNHWMWERSAKQRCGLFVGGCGCEETGLLVGFCRPPKSHSKNSDQITRFRFPESPRPRSRMRKVMHIELFLGRIYSGPVVSRRASGTLSP